MHHTLESHKFFTAAAWILVVVFATFVFFMISEVGAEMVELSEDTARTEAELEAYSDAIRR